MSDKTVLGFQLGAEGAVLVGESDTHVTATHASQWRSQLHVAYNSHLHIKNSKSELLRCFCNVPVVYHAYHISHVLLVYTLTYCIFLRARGCGTMNFFKHFQHCEMRHFPRSSSYLWKSRSDIREIFVTGVTLDKKVPITIRKSSGSGIRTPQSTYDSGS